MNLIYFRTFKGPIASSENNFEIRINIVTGFKNLFTLFKACIAYPYRQVFVDFIG